MSSLEDTLRAGAAALVRAGIEGARSEARLLAAHVTGLSSLEIFNARDMAISGEKRAYFDSLIERRANGEPVAYLTGTREFWSLPFHVSPATLIPRPDTETLIEQACTVFADGPTPGSILDLGAGTGCILLALLSEFPGASGTALDISPDALTIAGENASAMGLTARVDLIEGSWGAALPATFDLVVSNPPYIPSADIPALAPDVRAYEPLEALDGGPDGLDAYRALIPLAGRYLAPQGALIVEIGQGQLDDVIAIAEDVGLAVVSVSADLAGIDRAICFCKKGVGIPRGKG